MPVMKRPAMRSSGALATRHTVDRMAPMNANTRLINIVPFLKSVTLDDYMKSILCYEKDVLDYANFYMYSWYQTVYEK